MCVVALKNVTPPRPNSFAVAGLQQFHFEFLKTDLRDGERRCPSCLVKFPCMDLKVSTEQVTQVSFTCDAADLMTREVSSYCCSRSHINLLLLIRHPLLIKTGKGAVCDTHLLVTADRVDHAIS